VTMSLAEAKKLPGVRAVFGEKYPDPVRVLMIGAIKPSEATEDDSIEFCGGTHLSNTGQAGFFKIIGQELVAKGVPILRGPTDLPDWRHRTLFFRDPEDNIIEIYAEY